MNALLRNRALALTGAVMALLALVFTACDLSSADSTTAVLADSSGTIYNFSGLYMAPNGDSSTPLVYPAGRQSGTPVTWMRLLQNGSSLEGYDNARQNWQGKISGLDGPVASFSLRGRTTAGQAVDIAGTMTYVDQKSRVDATWIEPQFAGSFLAQATVAPAVTSAPPSRLSINPPSPTLGTTTTTVGLNAVGGTPPYSWSVSRPDLGSVSPTTGASVTYTRTQTAGANTVTVRDSANQTATATVTFTGSLVIQDLAISPQEWIFVDGGGLSVQFTVSGGVLPYTWEVSNPNLGVLSSTTGSSVTYNRTQDRGTNTITVRDAVGRTVTAQAIY